MSLGGSTCQTGPKISLHFPHQLVCLFLCFCVSKLFTCTKNMSHTLLACDFIVNLMATLCTDVATSLAQ